MAALYSKLFIQQTWVFGDPVYEFPFANPGEVCVIRTMDHYIAPGAAATFTVADSHGATLWSVSYPGDSGAWEHWDGRQVMNFGDSLIWTIDGLILPTVQCSLRVSGYALTI